MLLSFNFIPILKIHCTSSRRQLLLTACVEHNKRPIVPCLDIKIRWNSTHDMLHGCLRVKSAFTELSEQIAKEQKEDPKLKAMNSADWDKIQLVVDFLEPFKQCK